MLAFATPLSDLHSSLSRISSIMFPLMPPAALIASNSSCIIWPYFWPFSEIIRIDAPMRISPA